jgi:hypothetical protein
MNSAQFIALFPAAAESLFRKHEELNSLVYSALMIQIIREDVSLCSPGLNERKELKSVREGAPCATTC